MLSFIHLSDIHFHNYSGDAYDIDEDLRNELLNDISLNLKKEIPSVDGILICGDIAFSGQDRQYEIATAFLNSICDILSLDKLRVFCVPGNHDVDQNVTRNQRSVQLFQHDLDSAGNVTQYDIALANAFRIPGDADIMCKPIEHYNAFAAQYGCSFEERSIWEQEMRLNDDYTLGIVGINSTIISNESDHGADNAERPMRISHMQIPKRKDKIIYLTLCHHPPECWVDPEKNLSKKMDARTVLQLYGHKHIQTIRETPTGIAVSSGATHPSRTEDDWIPRYNWITLETNKMGAKTFLSIKIYPRVLDKIENKFEVDKSLRTGSDFVEYSFCLNEATSVDTDNQALEEIFTPIESVVLPVKSWERKFMYDFINLPFFCRESILKDFNLTIPTDEGKKHAELLPEFMRRAICNSCVQQLLDRIKDEKGRIDNL
ncbi:metallophosphoesterase [Oscillibacter sp.]|uniref:metallophosphoesterase family protein n=1 Tax=Oscillibacter sp. TaxID=1945593 RepID=UPI0028AD0C75|nr:metallophosphoesterase [Oscillibacter sp.]